MINGNRIQFGYGDIAVTADLFGRIELQQIKPPQECGSRVKWEAVEEKGECIRVGSNYNDLVKLRAQLKQVEEQKCVEFEFDGYVFDFTNYNVKSVQVCLKHVDRAIGFIMRLMAC